MHIITISSETNCHGFSIQRPTLNMGQFGKWWRSSTYLILKKLEMQWLFDGCCSKQMKIMLWSDGYLREMSSARLGSFQNSIHHCWSLKKTEQEAALQLRFDGPKSFTRLSKWWRKQEWLVVFEAFGQKFSKCQNAKWENESIFWSWRLRLGLQNDQKIAYMWSVEGYLITC